MTKPTNEKRPKKKRPKKKAVDNAMYYYCKECRKPIKKRGYKESWFGTTIWFCSLKCIDKFVKVIK